MDFRNKTPNMHSDFNTCRFLLIIFLLFPTVFLVFFSLLDLGRFCGDLDFFFFSPYHKKYFQLYSWH